MSTVPLFPVHVRGSLEPRLSRWLWLVKWLLVIPHLVLLALLWAGFVVVSVVAWVAILVAGRYPRALFDFNVGVLRWTWRVAFYAYGALGTDRYPPFTLAPVEYPAELEIEYPERLSRGLALVKWWLLALPHYLVLALFLGSGVWVALRWPLGFAFGGGLIGLLVLVAGVALAVTGRYPNGLFDFVLGLDRWVLRVIAYAALLTDRYPPFRLDQGPQEPGLPPPSAEAGAEAGPTAPASRWTAGRVALLVAGSLASLVALGLLVAGTAMVAIDQTQRDEAGFLMTPGERLSSTGYAIVSESVDVSVGGPDWVVGDVLGIVKVETEAVRPVFVGIAREADVARYLAGVRRSVVTDLGQDPAYREETGGAPRGAPGEQTFWAASATGAGVRSLTWEPEDGTWQVVVMNEDASPGVEVKASVGAELDPFLWIGIGLLVAGGLLGLGGPLAIASAARRAARASA
ncbi:MAG TPA: DUF4389 domain-containing protein [Gaiellaceae bacterium]|nr:DUF4389 domain-containing protein [Gaiellaceae bacterium]